MEIISDNNNNLSPNKEIKNKLIDDLEIQSMLINLLIGCGSVKSKNDYFIENYTQAPSYTIQQYIYTGYRINFGTPKLIFKSLFMIHNELVNIWSHILGALLVIGILVYISCVNKITINTESQNFALENYKSIKYFFILIFSSQTYNYRVKDFETKLKVWKNSNENLNSKGLISYNKNDKNMKSTLSSLDKLKIFLQEKNFEWVESHFYSQISKIQNLLKSFNKKTNNLSRFPIIVFLISAIFCLLCSAFYHLFYIMNIEMNQIFTKIDYAGINILITGSCFPLFVYGFFCQSIFYVIYLSSIGIVSLTVFFLSLTEFIHKDENRKIKGIMYGSLGILAGTPILHLVIISAIPIHIVPFFLGMGAFYLGGLAIYVGRCPEKHKPGKFDICVFFYN